MNHSLIDNYQESGDRQQLEKIIQHYSFLVQKQVDKFNHSAEASINRDDLISFGVIGLIDACQKFDSSKNVPFEAYARIRIRGAILDGLRKFDFVPRNLREEVKSLHNSFRDLEQKLGREPTNSELGQYLNKSVPEIDKLWQESNWIVPSYLSDVIASGEQELKLEDIYPDNDSPDPQQTVVNQANVKELAEAIDSLPYKEKTVLSLYYYEELNLKEIAEIMGLSESRISQLHSKGIMRLRGRLSGKKQNLY